MEDITLGTNFGALQSQTTLEKPLGWNGLEWHTAQTVSHRTHHPTLKHPGVFHARSLNL